MSWSKKNRFNVLNATSAQLIRWVILTVINKSINIWTFHLKQNLKPCISSDLGLDLSRHTAAASVYWSSAIAVCTTLVIARRSYRLKSCRHTSGCSQCQRACSLPVVIWLPLIVKKYWSNYAVFLYFEHANHGCELVRTVVLQQDFRECWMVHWSKSFS